LPRAKAVAHPVVGRIESSGREIHAKIAGGRKPSMKFSLRSLSNVRHTPRGAFFEMAGRKKKRTLTVSTVRTFAQTLRMIALSKSDPADYRLPTHPLEDMDVKRAKDALKNGPPFQYDLQWAKASALLLEMGVRAEQQAFAKFDLNCVMDTYLPEKLKHPERFLP
jgi:DNA topoisomerase VI subunit A